METLSSFQIKFPIPLLYVEEDGELILKKAGKSPGINKKNEGKDPNVKLSNLYKPLFRRFRAFLRTKFD